MSEGAENEIEIAWNRMRDRVTAVGGERVEGPTDAYRVDEEKARAMLVGLDVNWKHLEWGSRQMGYHVTRAILANTHEGMSDGEVSELLERVVASSWIDGFGIGMLVQERRIQGDRSHQYAPDVTELGSTETNDCECDQAIEAKLGLGWLTSQERFDTQEVECPTCSKVYVLSDTDDGPIWIPRIDPDKPPEHHHV